MTGSKRWFLSSLAYLALVQPAYGMGPSSEEMPILLKRFVTMDVKDVEKMVDQSINVKEEDDDIFYNQLAETLAFKVLPHPSFSTRQAGIGRIGMKIMENTEWIEVYTRAAKKLIASINGAQSGAQKATALSALTNLVVELRPKKTDYLELLAEIRDAKLEVSKEAADYAAQPIRRLVSPSEEAALALNK